MKIGYDPKEIHNVWAPVGNERRFIKKAKVMNNTVFDCDEIANDDRPVYFVPIYPTYDSGWGFYVNEISFTYTASSSGTHLTKRSTESLPDTWKYKCGYYMLALRSGDVIRPKESLTGYAFNPDDFSGSQDTWFIYIDTKRVYIQDSSHASSSDIGSGISLTEFNTNQTKIKPYIQDDDLEKTVNLIIPSSKAFYIKRTNIFVTTTNPELERFIKMPSSTTTIYYIIKVKIKHNEAITIYFDSEWSTLYWSDFSTINSNYFDFKDRKITTSTSRTIDSKNIINDIASYSGATFYGKPILPIIRKINWYLPEITWVESTEYSNLFCFVPTDEYGRVLVNYDDFKMKLNGDIWYNNISHVAKDNETVIIRSDAQICYSTIFQEEGIKNEYGNVVNENVSGWYNLDNILFSGQNDCIKVLNSNTNMLFDFTDIFDNIKNSYNKGALKISVNKTKAILLIPVVFTAAHLRQIRTK